MERFRQLYGISLTRQKLHEMVLMLVALETVFAFSYLGYIQYWNVSTTSMHVLVIVAAMILGGEGKHSCGVRVRSFIHVDWNVCDSGARQAVLSDRQRDAA